MCTNQKWVNTKCSGSINRFAIRTTTDAGHGDKKYNSKKRFDPGTCHGCEDDVVGESERTPITVYFEGKWVDLEKDYALKVEEWVDYWLYIYGIDNQRMRYDNYILKKSDDPLKSDEKEVVWRAEKANDNKSSVLVSIHLDSTDKAGCIFFYRIKPKKGELGYATSLRISEEGEKLGKTIADCMKTLPPEKPEQNDYIRDDTRTGPGSLGVLRNFTGKAAVLIELCGIENYNSKLLISKSANEIGKEIATGVYKYLFGKNAEPLELRKNIITSDNQSNGVGGGVNTNSQHWELSCRQGDSRAVQLSISNGEIAVKTVSSSLGVNDIWLVRNNILLGQKGSYRLTFEAYVDCTVSANFRQPHSSNNPVRLHIHRFVF